MVELQVLWRTRRRRVLAGCVTVLFAILAFGFALASPAMAGEHGYCHSLVPAHATCATGAHRSFYRNYANYWGSGHLQVCELSYSGSTVSSFKCNDRHVHSAYLSFADGGYCINAGDHKHTLKCKVAYL